MHDDYNTTPTFVAPLPQSVYQLPPFTRVRGPRFDVLDKQAPLPPRADLASSSHPSTISTATTSDSDSSLSEWSDRPVVVYTSTRPMERFNLTHEEMKLLEIHGLKQYDLADKRVWEGGAFADWLENPRLSVSSIAKVWATPHTSQLAPLAIRSLGSTASSSLQGIPWHFEWIGEFRAYCTITDVNVQRKMVEELVEWADPVPYQDSALIRLKGLNVAKGKMGRPEWTKEGGVPLLALAWQCVERAVTGGQDMPEKVASLAKALYDAFIGRREVLAMVFRELLQRCVWEEFKAWWQPGTAHGLSSAVHKKSREAYNVAFATIKFIGTLYAQRMVSAYFVHRVMRDLVLHMHATEQLRAMTMLISHGDSLLQYGSLRSDMNNLMRLCQQKSSHLQEWYTGAVASAQEIGKLLNQMHQCLRDWTRLDAGCYPPAQLQVPQGMMRASNSMPLYNHPAWSHSSLNPSASSFVAMQGRTQI